MRNSISRSLPGVGNPSIDLAPALWLPGALLLATWLLAGTGCNTTPTPEPAPEPGPEVVEVPEEATEPLAAPEIIPPASAWVYGREATLQWKGVPGARSYTFEVSSSPGFETVSLTEKLEVPLTSDAPPATLSRDFDPPFPAGEEFHVRLRAENPESQPSSWTITSGKLHLSRPELVNPAETGDPIRDPRPEFSWGPVPGATDYTVIVQTAGTDGEPVQSVFRKSSRETSIRLENALPRPGTYTVQVQGNQGDEAEGEWSTRTFTYLPPLPVIDSPAPGARLVTVNPRFRWSVPRAGAGSEASLRPFRLELSTVDAAGQISPPLAFEVEGNFFVPPPSFTFVRGQKYRVQVRETASGLASEPVEFEILPQPEEVHPVTAVLARADRHETRHALTADGQILAIASTAADSTGTNPRWKLDFFRREIPEGGGPASYQLLPEASLMHSSERLLRAHQLDLAWAPPGEGEPTLIIGLATDTFVGAFEGGLYRHELWSSELVPVLSDLRSVAINSLSLASHLEGGPIVFERHLDIGAADPTASPGPGEVSGFAPGNRRGIICRVNRNGTGLVTYRPGSQPAVSPSGEQVAFVVDDLSGPRLQLLDLASSQVSDLPLRTEPGDRIRGLAWCPAGDHLALSRKVARDGAGFDIVLLDLEGGREEVITRSFADDMDPTFVPSSRLDLDFEGILFSSNRSGESWDVFRLDLER